MKSFTAQIVFMILGGLLPLFFHSLKTAGKFWEFWYFLVDNAWRWLTIGIIFVIIQSLLYFEGAAIIQALSNFGFFVPLVSASVIGFAVSLFAMKYAPTTSIIAPQDE